MKRSLKTSMSYSVMGKMRHLMILVLAPLLLTGCASGYASKFGKTTSADIGYFTDHTISLISQVELGLTRDEAIYTRQYFDKNGKEEKRHFALLKEIDYLMQSIIRYSIALVTIAETNSTDAERVAAYAAYLDTMEDWVERELDLGETHYASVVETVRNQEKFQDALIQAQPIINAVSRYGGLLIDEFHDSADDLSIKIDSRIDFEYREFIEYEEALQNEKFAVLDTLEQLYRTYSGEADAFEELRKSRVIQNKDLIPEGAPTINDMKKISEHLHVRLKALRRIETEIQDDWGDYRKTHAELDKLYDNLVGATNRTRVVLLVWLRAHQKMASGKVDPAEWFDVSELPGTLFKAGASLVF